MPISELPTELVLEFMSWFPLKSLIAARGVNQSWRHLVLLSSILPARRALLDLYYDVIQTPDFLRTRRGVIDALEPFDREQYVDLLEGQIRGPLPAEFRFWVLEWPAKAVFGWTWPGLSTDISICNILDFNDPSADLLEFGRDEDEDGATARVIDHDEPYSKAWSLLIWHNFYQSGEVDSDVLVLDFREPEMYGTMQHATPTIRGLFFRPRLSPCISWVDWLRNKPEFHQG